MPAGPPPPFPTPGENVCLAAACLWMAGLPAYLDETDVGRECGRHARVASAVLPPPVAGQASCVAYVNFPSVRCALECSFRMQLEICAHGMRQGVFAGGS